MELRGESEDAARSGLADKLGGLPRRPGVYRFTNAAGRTIYVGKAKSLRNRVRSYFQPSARHGARVERMVAEIRDLDVIVVDTEIEALILEANLIKRERPRYNVLLRDDKSFPFLRLTMRDEYPRASLVRRARLDGSQYVGPFLPASSARRSLGILQRHFRVATCKEVFDGKRRPCLYYHLDQCLAPCAGKTTPEEYAAAVEDARLFLDGRHKDLEDSLRRRMKQASRSQDYETAGRFRDVLRTLKALGVRQRMTSVGLEQQDYWGHHAEGPQAALQLFQMRDGRIQGRREFTVEAEDLDPAAIFATALVQYYEDVEPPPEIYVPHAPERRELIEEWLAKRREARVRLKIPLRGPKKKLLSLVSKNAALAFESRFRAGQTHGVQALDALACALGLDGPPFRIECFDISNIQGTDSVASMVVWEGGKPRKGDYRTYTVREVDGADDTASIAEAVTRRYRRLVAEDRRLPDLVLIDGGRGQLGAAVAALAHLGLPTVPVASIAKREEEIHMPGRRPLRLDRGSAALQLLQRIRDEAHRFAVSRHRRKRARRTLRTGLTDVPGVGPARARMLLREFGSVEGVRGATREELAKSVGVRLAEAIVVHLRRRD